MKAYVIGGNKDYLNFMPDVEFTDNIKDAQLVVFGDGPAVSPSLYKDKKISSLTDIKHDINRDRADKAIYTKLSKDQVAIGIGRGANFLAVMNGARLIQYGIRKNSDFSYNIEFKNGDKKYVFSAISNNNQPICLADCDDNDFMIFGRSKETSDYICEDKEVVRMMRYNGDPEIIKFQKQGRPKCICIHFRPDLMPKSYISGLVKKIIYKHAN